MTADERFDRIDQELQRVHKYLIEFRTEAMQRLDDLGRQVDILSGTVSSIDARMPVLTRSLTAMERRIYQGANAQRDQAADLDARLRKIEGVA